MSSAYDLLRKGFNRAVALAFLGIRSSKPERIENNRRIAASFGVFIGLDIEIGGVAELLEEFGIRLERGIARAEKAKIEFDWVAYSHEFIEQLATLIYETDLDFPSDEINALATVGENRAG